MIIKIIIIVLVFITSNSIIPKNTYVSSEINVFKEKEEPKKETTKKAQVNKKEVKKANIKNKVLATYTGNITAYGPDCKGCIGITASGYNVKNTIYYNDKEYGKIRIVAADKSLPFGTIVKISNLSNYKSPIIAIVLDRGSAIGFNKKAYFDLLCNSERESNSFGRRKATFEILRKGY